MSLLAAIEGWDRSLFVTINQEASNPLFDLLFPFVSNVHQNYWLQWVLGPLFLIGLFWRYRMRAVAWLFSMVVTVGLSDLISYHLLKESAQRTRPHQVAELQSVVRVPYAPKSYSMPSNHALNSFAAATVSSWFAPRFFPAFFVLASLGAYSRVYVGVHYPADILVGALFGWCMAWLLRWLVFRRLGFFRQSLRM